MRVLRSLLVGCCTVPLLAAPVTAPAGAAPHPVAPEIHELSVDLDTSASAPLPTDAESQAPAAGADVRARQSAESSVGSLSEPAAPAAPVVLETPRLEVADFASVGATWQADTSGSALSVEVRTESDGQWGTWTALRRMDGGPDAGTEEAQRAARGATESLWVGDSTAVQVRVTGAASSLPDALQLALIDPGTSAADGSPRAPIASADAATPYPPIIGRADWGADESLKNCSPSYNSTIKAAVLHHTAGPNTYSTMAEAMRQLRSDYAYHTNTLGWCDLGYNFVVDKWGNIYEGRAGGVSKPVVGAHAGGFNKDTFGVSMLGTYSTEAPPLAQRRAVEDLMAWKLSLHRVDPTGVARLTSAGGGTSKYPAGQSVTLPTIMGHRDVGSTECPGNAGYATLPEIRAETASRILDVPFLQAMYHDMLTRTADPGGLATWTDLLAGGGWNHRRVSQAFAGADEYRLLSIDSAYRSVLGRAPDPGGRQSWLDGLRRGTVGLDRLRPALMASEEFYLRGGSSDAAFVDNIYRAALGRGAGASEVAFWGAVRRTQGPVPVINGVWGSPEAGMRRVDGAYQYYLGRRAGGSEQRYWLPVVMGAGDEQLREELTSSLEYLLRAQNRFP